jgi:uncharacterized protein (TIGR02302 family)
LTDPADKHASAKIEKAKIAKTARDPARVRLDRLVAYARAAHVWERLWRALIPPLIVLGLFLCVSWLGVWMELPHLGRLVGVGVFALLFLASLFGLRHLVPLSRHDALRRIDQASGIGHRPASVLDDTLANAGTDPGTAALWAVHRRRAESRAKDLRAGKPSPRAVDLDRYALRFGVVVALIACGAVAGSERYARTAAAFDWGLSGNDGPGYRLDAWIDPPPYTGKPPVLLDLASNTARDEEHPLHIEAPAGSTVIVRSAGGTVDLETRGPLQPPPAKDPKAGDKPAAPAPQVAGDTDRRLVLLGDSHLTLRHRGDLRGSFDLTAIADKPPVIMLRDIPKANARGSLTLAYTAGDDYGVSAAEAVFANPKIDGVPAPGPSLVDPPKMALSIPATQNGLGDGETTGDLSEHPWAGTRVTMTLVAHDEGGNEGRSEPVEITLPQKPFSNPLARALVEQRRNLVLDPDHRANVQSALEALMIEPEAFKTTTAVYLGLRFAGKSLESARSKADLVAVADFLWGMALQLENGDLSDAERALRAAEKELREAIDRKAPEEEIKKLTDNLQAAMDKFLSELAQQQQREEQKDADSQQSKGKSISQKQLQAMLDKLKEASRSGNKEEAKKALEALQEMLENLKTAKRQKPDPKARAMAQALNELDQMTRDQQDLRDQTYKDGQDHADQLPPPQRQDRPRNGQARRGQQPGQQGAKPNDAEDQAEANPDEGDQSGAKRPGAPKHEQKDALQKRQKDLRDRLDGVQKKLKQAGKGQEGLDEANQAMKDAEDALAQGQGSRGEAVDDQGKALEGMRKGAKKLADAMQKGEDGEGQDESDKEGQGEKGSKEGQQTGDADPLGRPRGGNPFNTNSKFDPMGVPAAQRAQRVLEELRHRLGDPSRPREETDYLERLLRPY